MSTAIRAVDSPNVDNGRKSFTDLRIEKVERLYGQAMTFFHNGYAAEAAELMIDAAAYLAEDRRTFCAIMAFLTGLDDERGCDEEDVAALDEVAAEARRLAS